MSLEVERHSGRMQLRALAHPVRLRIMSLLTASAMTAAEVARELDMNHANASYHLRQLYAAGAIAIVGEERIRGGVAKRYRYLQASEEPVTESSPGELAARRTLYRALALELQRRSDQVRLGGNRAHLTDADLWVTPEVWETVRAQFHEASLTLHREALPPRSPGAIRVNATAALFEMEPEV